MLDVGVAALADSREDHLALVRHAVPVRVGPLHDLVGVGLAGQDDAVLEGQIVEYSLTSLAFNQSANVTQYRLQIALALTLRDRTKNVIWKQERIGERADFPVTGQVTTTLAREQDAVKRAAVDVARAIVSLAFEGF